MRDYFTSRFGLTLIVASFAVLAATIWYGSTGDASDFQLNLLAGAAGIAVGVLLVGPLLLQFDEYRLKKRWSDVRSSIYNNTDDRLLDIVIDMFVHLPVKDNSPLTSLLTSGDEGRGEAGAAMVKLSEQLVSPPSDQTELDEFCRRAKRYYAAAEGSLAEISATLNSHILTECSDETVVQRMVSFDIAHRNLKRALSASDSGFLPAGQVHSAVSELLLEAKNLHEVIG